MLLLSAYTTGILRALVLTKFNTWRPNYACTPVTFSHTNHLMTGSDLRKQLVMSAGAAGSVEVGLTVAGGDGDVEVDEDVDVAAVGLGGRDGDDGD